MYSLNKDTDLSFLSRKKLLQVCVGEFQIILKFDSDILLSLECVFEHVLKHGQVLQGDLSNPSSANSLLSLVGSFIIRVENLGKGNLELAFANGDTVRIYDSNNDAESYQISSPRGMIIV